MHDGILSSIWFACVIGLAFLLGMRDRKIKQLTKGLQQLYEELQWKKKEIKALKAGTVHFACPVCSAVSFNPNDAREGWCGKCHAQTGERQV